MRTLLGAVVRPLLGSAQPRRALAAPRRTRDQLAQAVAATEQALAHVKVRARACWCCVLNS